MKYDVAHLSFGKHVEFCFLDTGELDTYLNVIIRQSGWPETADSVCVCVKISIRGKSLRTRPGPWLKKGKGPPPLWQTSAFVLRPMETSNLCLTHRKGQA